MAWDNESLIGFHKAAESLKLFRRADLSDPEHNTSLIDELYIDSLPHEAILEKMMRPSTTFLIGRKGTGKSTIFQRLQSQLRRSKHQTSAYIDIKTVYESSQVDPAMLDRLSKESDALPPRALERLLLYKEFLHAVILEIKQELRKRVESSLWERVKEGVTGGISSLFESLDTILEEADEQRFINAIAFRRSEVQTKTSSSDEVSGKANISVALGPNPSASAGAETASKLVRTSDNDQSFSEVLLRTFNIKSLIERLKEVLEELGIRHLYVLVDDFSELPEDAMRVVVDVLLAPLNNWSDEFVKFKVAGYPGRIYYGLIDKTKIEEIYLDVYKLYGGSDVGRMEESAIDFTRRLVTSRLAYFSKRSASDFIEGEESEIWRQMFYASMANPRTLGWLLSFVYESHLIQGRGFGVRAIQEAAERYYEEKVEPYFHMGKFLHDSFGERSSIFSLKELLEALVARARELRQHSSDLIRKIPGRHPTSHFNIPQPYERLFSTLELNFFLTRYYEMTDRSARKVSVFALNYGLCSKFDIRFGRPVGEREFRLYFVERFFDYSAIVSAYLSKNQEILCDDAECGKRFSYEQLDAIQLFGMLCPNCKKGTVRVTNLSQKYAEELRAVGKDLLLPPTELGILQTLHVEKQPLRPMSIAGELDCSWQLIGRRGRKLADRGLIERTENDQGHRIFEITPTAEAAYFSDAEADKLKLDEERAVVSTRASEGPRQGA
jgi:Cdc6-like AAA superfamily ATPase/DNA-binding MarR family transcriptional regulator